MNTPKLSPRAAAALEATDNHIFETAACLPSAQIHPFLRAVCSKIEPSIWIRVDTTSPRPNQTVLVYTGHPNNPVISATLYISREERMWLNELGQTIRPPSHWRPYPAAPGGTPTLADSPAPAG